MSLVSDQHVTINDFAGHLLDASYSLLGLPNLSREDRFMIVLDLSFFCRIEMGRPTAYEEFRAYLSTMLEPFITESWAESFGFADEVKTLPTMTGIESAPEPRPRFDAFVDRFVAAWFPIFKGLELVLEPFRPRMVSSPPRPSDTEIRDDAVPAMAAYMRGPEVQTALGLALPPEWRLTQHMGVEDKPKFVLYQHAFDVNKHRPLRTNAYIMVYLPHRLLQGVSDIRQTFA